jgi:hypothetical protein
LKHEGPDLTSDLGTTQVGSFPELGISQGTRIGIAVDGWAYLRVWLVAFVDDALDLIAQAGEPGRNGSVVDIMGRVRASLGYHVTVRSILSLQLSNVPLKFQISICQRLLLTC